MHLYFCMARFMAATSDFGWTSECKVCEADEETISVGLVVKCVIQMLRVVRNKSSKVRDLKVHLLALHMCVCNPFPKGCAI